MISALVALVPMFSSSIFRRRLLGLYRGGGSVNFLVAWILVIGTEPRSLCRGESPSIRCREAASGSKYVDRRLMPRGTASPLLRGFWMGCIRSVCRLPTVDWRDRTDKAGSAVCFESPHSRPRELHSYSHLRPLPLRRWLGSFPSRIQGQNSARSALLLLQSSKTAWE